MLYEVITYVKEIPPSRGQVEIVVLLFDAEPDPEHYTWRQTWYAEHEEESTLCFFATDYMSELVITSYSIHYTKLYDRSNSLNFTLQSARDPTMKNALDKLLWGVVAVLLVVLISIFLRHYLSYNFV